MAVLGRTEEGREGQCFHLEGKLVDVLAPAEYTHWPAGRKGEEAEWAAVQICRKVLYCLQ